LEEFFKELLLDVHFGAVSLIHSALQRNAATLCNILAPFSFIHVINYFLFLFFLIFSHSFLIFKFTNDRVLNQLHIFSNFNGSEINCGILLKKYYLIVSSQLVHGLERGVSKYDT